MFTRMFFYKGHGLKYFKPFSYRQSVINQEIYVYKVDWEGKDMNLMNEFKKEKKELKEISSDDDEESLGGNRTV